MGEKKHKRKAAKAAMRAAARQLAQSVLTVPGPSVAGAAGAAASVVQAPVNRPPRSGSIAIVADRGDRGHLLTWAAAGQLQAGDAGAARGLMQQALQSGMDRRAAARLLLGGAYTRLGRASLLAQRPAGAVRQLRTGLALGVPGGAALCTDLLMAEAERCSRAGDDREATQRWQDIAGLLGEKTPEYVYARLSDAMARNRQGHGGTKAENRVWGDCHKHDLLSYMHARLQPALYLEIGVDEGIGLARATGPAIGVDPRPALDLKVTLGEQVRIVPLSSDGFFREQAAALLQPPPELVFIDGMHLFEFALRDFMQVERFAGPATLVAIDDIYPCHPAQAERRRRTGSWTGDVWKLHRILREQRPDLTLLALNANTTGLLLIAGLDPDNRVLWDAYDAIVRAHVDDRPPPAEVLARHGAIPSDHPLFGQVLDLLHTAKSAHWTVAEVRNALKALAPAIAAAQAEYRGRAEQLSGQCRLMQPNALPGDCDV